MGKMNLLKANWEGKVGETVGAKWKNKKTIRTYTKPSNPNTADQQKVRGVFGEMTTFVSKFADGIKYLTALDTSGMSARNAILKLNKDQIEGGTFTKASLAISRGGLQKVQGLAATATAGIITATWTPPTATNFTTKAVAVIVAVDAGNDIAEVFTAAASGGTATGTVNFGSATGIDVYAYFLDYRGSNKVASASAYVATA